jgi:phage terminase small subunit
MDKVGYGTRAAAAPVWGRAENAMIAILQAFAGSGVSACSRVTLFCGSFEQYENHHENRKTEGFVAE